MQLSKIKLSGFKSFVDPTTILLPSNLIAVVGPNGCGKSNIIDAVSWVMGESSPKYLRGESMSDVIFNGSSARKPVGQAAVELVFDNTTGTIGGEYAQYTEISIKRVLERDMESSYFLNGTRCRKRDITDLFLGTGLGPRRYAIIGQNMITMIVEAKPNELRMQLEEAAGISKYKERRHETALSIQRTKENMTRLTDIGSELEKQLSHLKYQAHAAEKYQTLKKEERLLQAECHSLEWRQFNQLLLQDRLQLQQNETVLEKKQSELSTCHYELETIRAEQQSAQQALDNIQQRYYTIGNEITRLEQQCLHHDTKTKQWQTDLLQIEADRQAVNEQLQEAMDQLAEMATDLTQLEPQLVTTEAQLVTLQNTHRALENKMTAWQKTWDHYQQQMAQATQAVQSQQSAIQHIEQKIHFLEQQLTQVDWHHEIANPFDQLNEAIPALQQTERKLKAQLEAIQARYIVDRQRLVEAKTILTEQTKQLEETQTILHTLHNQQALLEALQRTALGKQDNPALSWMAAHQLDQKPRLAEQLMVEEGWEKAVAIVLGHHAQAICVSQFNDVLSAIAQFNKGQVCILSPEKTPSFSPTLSGVLLLDKIQSDWPLTQLFSGIYAADTLEQALLLRHQLADDESVITKNGIWLSRFWVKILQSDDIQTGILKREKELKQLTIEIAKQEKQKQSLETKIATSETTIKQLEEQMNETQLSITQLTTEHAQVSVQITFKQERINELSQQTVKFQQDHAAYQAQLTQAQSSLTAAKQQHDILVTACHQAALQRPTLLSDRDQLQLTLNNNREAMDQQIAKKHELEIRTQTTRSQQATLKQHSDHLRAQEAVFLKRETALQQALSDLSSIDTLKQSLTRQLDEHVKAERYLTTARQLMEQLTEKQRLVEEKKQTFESERYQMTSVLESLRLEMNARQIKMDALREKVCETNYVIENLLQSLPESSDVSEWQQKVNQIAQRIQRLGAINLVAIDEYATCLERKTYLDKQLADLQTGLNTLEDAIKKIDQEMRIRFKETFDQVSQRFQELFPMIFGGGRATLELENDNVLESGVMMIACPPGKRNSSIHLLSGGEKTLTALAFIFAIFYLNPAPFCLLDEVDAALDDMNVLRFIKLVKTMSEKTQFIFVSHNKMTVELGTCLLGVTMHEPGVSRLVSVDIETAMSLASA